MSLFNPKLQAYIVGIVDGERMLIQLEPGAQINVKRNWNSPADAAYGVPPNWTSVTIAGMVANAQVWQDGMNPEDLVQPEIEAPALQLEQDPDICPECGHHYLTKGSTAMSHADWLAFNQWLVGGKPAIEERRAPVQRDRDRGKPAGSISWGEHLEAWNYYASRWPGQSAERIAERGGFGYGELQQFLGHDPVTWKAN